MSNANISRAGFADEKSCQVNRVCSRKRTFVTFFK